jgi:hypothetical protein
VSSSLLWGVPPVLFVVIIIRQEDAADMLTQPDARCWGPNSQLPFPVLSLLLLLLLLLVGCCLCVSQSLACS